MRGGKLPEPMMVAGLAAAPGSSSGCVLVSGADPFFTQAREQGAKTAENGVQTVFKRCLNGVETVFSVFAKTQNAREERFGFRP